MFEASVDGQLYDPERFSSFYRPYGMDAPAQSLAPAPAAPAPATVVAEASTDTGWQEPAPAPTSAAADPVPAAGGDKPDAAAILSMIRSRKDG